jgi:Alpha/beta hydrolase domain
MGMKRRRPWQGRHGLAVAFAAAAAVLVGAAPAGAQASTTAPVHAAASAASPVISGPVTGGKGQIVLQGTDFALSSVGYTQSEYFLSGTATSYKPTAPLGANGKWRVAPATAALYTTRIVVDRPANPARFNGTVIVEWLNVSAGLDTAADWIYGHTQLIRDGYAWVGVSAQQVGVNELKAADPARYAALSDPGDSYSYDIFSQAGQAVRDDPAQVLGGLRPGTVIAEGESQSAFRLTTYIDAVQPLAHEYDGFLVHSREGTAAPLSQSPQATVNAPAVVDFRPHLGVPVLDAETETDVLSPLIGYLPATQPDTPAFRLWEIAGTAHADAYELALGAGDTGNGATDVQELNSMLNPPDINIPGEFSCALPTNTGEEHYVIDAAEVALNRWVTTGVPPASPSLLDVNTSGATPTYVTDANGNVKGGIRTPAVQVPVATLSGLGNSGSGALGTFCGLFGATTPFSTAKLGALYPTHAQFVGKWTAATLPDVAEGFITPADAFHLIAAAKASSISG